MTNYSFGYGFVEYSRPEDAARAIQTLKGYPIQNKRLGVTLSRVYKKEDLKNTNLVKIIKLLKTIWVESHQALPFKAQLYKKY